MSNQTKGKVPQEKWDKLIEKHAAKRMEQDRLAASLGNMPSSVNANEFLVAQPGGHAPRRRKDVPREVWDKPERNRSRLREEWYKLKASIDKATKEETQYLVQKPSVPLEVLNASILNFNREGVDGKKSVRFDEQNVEATSRSEGEMRGLDASKTVQRLVSTYPRTGPFVENRFKNSAASGGGDEQGGARSKGQHKNPREWVTETLAWLDAHGFAGQSVSQKKCIVKAIMLDEKCIGFRDHEGIVTPLKLCWKIEPLRELMQWINLGWPEVVSTRQCIVHLNDAQWHVEKAHQSFEALLSESSKRRKDIFFGKIAGTTSFVSGRACVIKQFEYS